MRMRAHDRAMIARRARACIFYILHSRYTIMHAFAYSRFEVRAVLFYCLSESESEIYSNDTVLPYTT